ncbi:membrane fusion protein Use1-domain-containing protein [Baffinella frigidus]|nr:membrane fusion protein Use1-domain-containing protein [Cryptophyta sp. CCMP2293]
MVTETEPVQSSRAEINFVRLALSCEAQPDGDSAAAAGDDGVGGASEWRRLEAYARRLRELLEDIRRGEQQPSKQQLVEYERMLSAVAARADLARRRTEEQAREAREQTAWRGGGSSAHAPADTVPLSAEAPALNAPVAPTLKKSLVDRRSQLLGEGGETARARLVRRRGGAGGHVSETLKDDKKRQERMQEELASMTSALKNNVKAIHSTIDNARLSTMDTDMAKNVNKISTTNVKVDEQRARNQRTTCFQCLTVIVVTTLFFATFFLMRLSSKAPVLAQVAVPHIMLPSSPFSGAAAEVRFSCATPGATIQYSADGSHPGRDALAFDAKAKDSPSVLADTAKASGGKEVELESIRKMLVRAADTGYSKWHNA